MNQPKEKSLSLSDQVAIELREDIIGGRLLPGMPLTESELVNAYNASRNTVREALHQFQAPGQAHGDPAGVLMGGRDIGQPAVVQMRQRRTVFRRHARP